MLAVLVIHAAAIGGLLVYGVHPRQPVTEEDVIEALILPDATPEAIEPTPPQVADWRPVLPEIPLPELSLEQTSTAITLPPPIPKPQVAASAGRTEVDAPPLIDAQAVGYLVPPAPRYPSASRRAREEGEVLVRVLIDVDGRPSEVSILRSSGYARLDDAAMEAVRAALFRPYVAAGRARAAYVHVPVEFALRRG